jgi:membrane fusion protein, multidrug efflux system
MNRSRAIAGGSLLTVAAVALILILTAGSSDGGTGGGAKALSGFTTVQRRNLVSTDTQSGTLGYKNSETVYNWESGAITWLPAVGQVIKPGHTLFDIANQPVVLMDGTTPAYRELTSSDSRGPDILELNRNLVDLGYDPDGIVVDDKWQAATTAGVEALQTAQEQTATGSLSLGKVVFLPGPQLIDTIDGAIGSTGGGSGTADGNRTLATDFVDYSTPRNTPSTTTTTATSTTTVPTVTETVTVTEKPPPTPKPKHHKTPTSKSPAGGSSSPGKGGSTSPSGSSSPGSGSGSGNAVAILQTSSTQLIATVDLAATSQSEAHLGSTVSVEMPNGSYVNGKITAVSPIAQSSSNSGSGSGGSPTIPVTITLDKHVSGAGLDQAAVSVVFSQAKASHVLSVPVTALIATSGDSYAVQEARSPYRLLPINTGLFAAGYVQISGPGIVPGLRVTDSQG